MKTDSAITHPCEDKLETKFFSFYLAKSLLSFFKQKDSIVVGICGAWGEGKTSIINMALKYLQVLHKEYTEDIEAAEKKIPMHKSWNKNRIKNIIDIVSKVMVFILSFLYWEMFFEFLFWFNLPINLLFFILILLSFYWLINKLLYVVTRKFFGNKDYIVINYNPWNYTNTEQMLKAFFKILTDELTFVNNEEINTVGNLIKNYVKIAHNIDLSFLPNLKINRTDNELKDEINRLLCKVNKKIFVVIDDIDRLLPNEILLIFKTVKIIADFPNTVYLLSYDKINVKKALSSLNIDAEDYIKKIVQIDKNIPIINKDIFKEKFLCELEKIPDSEYKNKELITKFYDFALSKYVKNLRDFNRFINTFEFIYSAYKNEEINILDLIGITAIEVFEPGLYQFIRNNKYLLCTGGVSFTGDPHIIMYDGTEKSALEIFESISKFNNIEAFSILFAKFFNEINLYSDKCTNVELKSIFEKIKLQLPDLTPFLIKDYKYRYENYRNIGNPNYFNLYFKVNLGNNTLTKMEKERLDQSLNNTSSFFKEMNNLYFINPEKINDYIFNWRSLYNKSNRTKDRTLQLLNNLLQINKKESNLLDFFEKTDFFVVFTRDFLNTYNEENQENKISKQDIVDTIKNNIVNLNENLFFFLFLICWQFEFPIDSRPLLTETEQKLKQDIYNILLENLTLDGLLNSNDAFQCTDYLLEYFKANEKIKDFFNTLLQDGNEENLCKILKTASNYQSSKLINPLAIIVQVVDQLELRHKFYNKLLQIHNDNQNNKFLEKEDFYVYDDYSCRTDNIVILSLEYFDNIKEKDFK